MSRVAVRTAVVADAPFIARVHLRSWQVGYRGIMPDEVLDAISLEQREERWRQILSGEEEPGFTVIADVDDRGVQGFGSGLPKSRDEDAGEVTALYVQRRAGRGHGTGVELARRTSAVTPRRASSMARVAGGGPSPRMTAEICHVGALVSRRTAIWGWR